MKTINNIGNKWSEDVCYYMRQVLIRGRDIVDFMGAEHPPCATEYIAPSAPNLHGWINRAAIVESVVKMMELAKTTDQCEHGLKEEVRRDLRRTIVEGKNVLDLLGEPHPLDFEEYM